MDDEAAFIIMTGGKPQFAALIAYGPLVPGHGIAADRKLSHL